MTDESPLSGAEIIEGLEAASDIDALGRMAVLKAAIAAFLSAGDRDSAQRAEWERVACAFSPTGQTVRGRWYGGLLIGNDGAGREMEWPRREDLNAPALQHLRERAVSSSNPHVQARFSDLLWEFVDPPDRNMAHRAVVAYVALVHYDLAHDVEHRAMNISRYLNRARFLATQVKDEALVAQVVAAHHVAFDGILARSTLPIVPCIEVLRSMMAHQNTAATVEIDDRIGTLEAWARAHEDDISSLLLEAILNVRIERSRQQKDHGAAHRYRLEVARLREREGDEVLESSPMIAQTFLLKAFTLYADLGATGDAARVKAKLQPISPKTLAEMKQVKTSVEVPRDTVERAAKVLRKHSPRDALRLLVHDSCWIPNVEGVKHYLEGAKSEYPLQFLFPKILMDAHGNAHPLSQGDERDRHDLFEHVVLRFFLSARLPMREAFRVLVEELNLTSDDLVAVIAETEWIDRGRLPILREAFDGYLAGRFISACHILIPQLEGLLREMASAAGVVTVGIRGARMIPQTMDACLTEPSVRDLLGEDLATTLEALLTDDAGQRIRHIVMHGNVTNASFFGRELTEGLIYLLLQLLGRSASPRGG